MSGGTLADDREDVAPQSDHGECHEAAAVLERKRPTKFVVLCMPRTGSTMLTDRLGSHGDVRCLSAIFSKAGWPSAGAAGHASPISGWIRKSLDPKWNEIEFRLSKPAKLLREIVAKSPDKRAVGLKHHVSANEITDFLLASSLRKIILTRNNLLAAYSSHKIAKATGQGNVLAGGAVIRTVVEFDLREFAKFRAKRERLYDYICERAGRRVIKIDYAEARKPDGLAGIGSFLGVDPGGFGTPQTVKRNSDDIVSRFVNRDLVLSSLRQIGLEHWATEN